MSEDPFLEVHLRYKAYCLFHGASTPKEMMDRDRKLYPGGFMCGYILWIGQMWRKFYKIFAQRYVCDGESEKWQDFDRWLLERVHQKTASSFCIDHRGG